MSTRSDAARRRALDAASGLIREQGVPAFTVDEVSRRSGVAKTTIYRHWDNGNALLLEAVNCALLPVPTPNNGDLKTDLAEFVRGALPVAGDVAMVKMATGLLYAAAGDPELHTAVKAFARQHHTPLRTIVQLAQARGQISADLDVDLAADLIEGPLMYRVLFRQEPLSAEQLDRLLDMMIAALRG